MATLEQIVESILVTNRIEPVFDLENDDWIRSRHWLVDSYGADGCAYTEATPEELALWLLLTSQLKEDFE